MAPDHADDPAFQEDETIVRASTVLARPDTADVTDTVLTAHPPLAAPSPSREESRTAAPGRREVAERDSSAVRDTTRVVPRVRMPDGGVVEIEGGTVYVGRRPSLPRVPASGIPQLVTVPSPGREVSSTHLALSAVGGAVVVRDMLSTNGTVVKAPGVPARTLLRGESTVAVPGAVLDLGDGNVIEVLG